LKDTEGATTIPSGSTLKRVEVQNILKLIKKTIIMSQWKYIPNFENLYSVNTDGEIYSHISHRKRKLVRRNDGYLAITLCKNKIKYQFLVHDLVLETFIGKKPTDKHECRHYPDPTRDNNKLENLQWSTHIKNEQDKSHILNDNQIIQIKNELLKQKNYKKVAEKFKIHIMVVSQIARGKTYSNIGPDISYINFDSRPLKSIEEIKEIKKMIKNNATYKEVSEKFSINRSYFYRIKNNEIRKDIE
jgi:hypothetical protein